MVEVEDRLCRHELKVSWVENVWRCMECEYWIGFSDIPRLRTLLLNYKAEARAARVIMEARNESV